MPEAKKTGSRKSTRTQLNFVGTSVFNQYRNGLENRGFTKWFKLVNNGVKKAYKNRTHRKDILNPLKINRFQGIFFFLAQSGDQSNNKSLNGFKDIYWQLIQEHPELTAR